ncbi:hypothetical protein N657DRAFT_295785 [Parathielavia appendiculata]|uniref:Uncharacterized protein n=1 Tax=Parathielavia appendiculata TaxID=2587402 RepID=A0AAN6U480_9PEZI|nr:hypothetical protein N657DRAFT_295785 [Parathielavia appendiculata]
MPPAHQFQSASVPSQPLKINTGTKNANFAGIPSSPHPATTPSTSLLLTLQGNAEQPRSFTRHRASIVGNCPRIQSSRILGILFHLCRCRSLTRSSPAGTCKHALIFPSLCSGIPFKQLSGKRPILAPEASERPQRLLGSLVANLTNDTKRPIHMASNRPHHRRDREMEMIVVCMPNDLLSHLCHHHPDNACISTSRQKD